MSKTTLITASTELHRLVTAAAEVAQTSKKKSRIINAYNQAFNQVEVVASFIPPKVSTFAQTKRSLKIVNNLVGGTLDGLHSDDLPLKELRALANDLLNVRLPNFLESVSNDSLVHDTKTGVVHHDLPESVKPEFIEDAKQKSSSPVKVKSSSSLSASKSFQQALMAAIVEYKTGNSEHLNAADVDEQPVFKEEDTGYSRTDNDKKIVSFLEGIQAQRGKLPLNLTNSHFSMVRMPVTPIFHASRVSGGIRVPGAAMDISGQPNPTRLLKAVGIQGVSLGGEYMVIDNQLLIAISKSVIPDGYEKMEDSDKNKLDRSLLTDSQKKTQLVKRKKVSENNVKLALRYVNYIITTLGERGDSFELVDIVPCTNPRNPDILLYWIMPTTKFNYLLRKGFPKILKWALPFK